MVELVVSILLVLESLLLAIHLKLHALVAIIVAEALIAYKLTRH